MLTFYLKKVIGMLLMPIPLTISGIILGLLLIKRFPRIGHGLIISSLVLLTLTSWHPIADRLLTPFENDYPMFDINHPVDVVIVLGGCHSSNDNMPEASQLCSSSVYRLLEGLRVLKHNPNALLFVSGYEGSDQRTHAEVSKEVAIALGVDSKRIVTFPQARDTQEEAQQMKPFLQTKSFALVTEASHLKRAVNFFEQAGLNPLPAPAVQLASDSSDWRVNASAQYKSERAFYEALGQLWQWLRS